MKRAPRSLQHHVLYRKYNGQDSEISALLGKCGLNSENWDALLAPRPENLKSLSADEFQKLTSIEVNDHRFWMRALTNQGRKIISWRGNECEGYSYIIFEGVRKCLGW